MGGRCVLDQPEWRNHSVMKSRCSFKVGAPERNVTEHASIDSTPLERLPPARRVRLLAVCEWEPTLAH